MDFKVIVLERVVKWLVGGELFAFVTEAVATINDDSITGEQKRAAVLASAKDMFSGALTMFINLAIEVAVIVLKAKIEDGN